jgi:hypothetical protein
MGFTYRPDLREGRIRTMEDFLAAVEKEHPAIAEMVRSGEVVDHHMYFDYFHKSERLYSEDGWFLVGDAARTVDPLYSNGLSMTTMQVLQVSEIIHRQRAGKLNPGDVDVLDEAGRWLMERAQREVTDQYPIMHDPFHACMRRYINVTGWFNAFLPLWWNGFFTTPEATRTMLGLFRDRDPDAMSLWELAARASARIGPDYTQEGFDRGPDIDALLNLRFDCSRDELMRCVGDMFLRRRTMRLQLLAMNGWRDLPRELPRLVTETLTPWMLRLLALRHRDAFRLARPPLPDLYGGDRADGGDDVEERAAI